MIIKINKHTGKESWYGKMSISSAEAKRLKGERVLMKDPEQQQAVVPKAPFFYRKL